MLTSYDRTSIDNLLETLASCFRLEGRAGGAMASQALLEARNQGFESKSTASDVPDSLVSKACGQRAALESAKLIERCCHLFHWSSWGDGVLAENIASNLYTTELVGPDGHFFHDDVRIGLLVSDMETDYPVSSHSGEETYYVISGTAEWTVDGGPYQFHPPGSFIHHPSWTPHGRRTSNEVFLGAWRWSGDLDLDSFKLEQ